MANMDLTPKSGGNGTNPAEENGAPKAADPRVKELEQEVARLRGELSELRRKYDVDRGPLGTPKGEEDAGDNAQFKELLHRLKEFGLEEAVQAYFLEGMPKTEEELREFISNPRPFRNLVEEVEQELGLGPQS